MPGFEGPILFLDVETTEFDLHRMIEAGGVRFRSLPRDARAIFTDTYGHQNAEPIGTWERWEVRDGVVWGIGRYLDGDERAEKAANMMQQGALSQVSVDPTDGRAVLEMLDADGSPTDDEDAWWDCMMEGGGCGMRQRWTDFEIGTATLVSMPAFAETRMVYLTDEELAERLGTEMAAEDTADEGEEEDEGAAVEQPETVAASASPVTAAVSVRFPTLAALATGRSVPADKVLEGGGGPTAAARSGAKPVRMTLTASVTEWAEDEGPDPAYFARLELEGPTPFTVTDHGEVYGHLACWGQPHLGFLAGSPSQFVVPERSPSDYRLFRANGQVRCSDGSRVPVGVITMGTEHAPQGTKGHRPSWADVTYHYEHTGSQLAHVAVYDDEWGIQCHGTLAPGVSETDIRRAMAARPSVDLRNAGEGLDLAGVLLVNQPGWPVTEPVVYELEDSTPYMLVASAAPRHQTECEVRVASSAPGQLARCSCHCAQTDSPKTDRLANLSRISRIRRRDELVGLAR